MRIKAIDFVACAFEESSTMKEAVSFYRDILGVTEDFVLGDGETGNWTEFDMHPVAFALVKSDQFAGKPAIALAVDDVYEAVTELRAKSVKVSVEPQDCGPCYMAGIEDPWGNPVILHARKDGTVG